MAGRRAILGWLGAGLAMPLARRAMAQAPAARDEAILAAKLTALAEGQLRMISREAILLDAIRLQNRRTHSFGPTLINRLDGEWRREVYNTNNRTLIPPVMNSPASHFLRQVMSLSEGLYTEFMAMDGRGLNVALSHLTPDYWQGDEDKYLMTFPAGPRAIHIGPDELNTLTGVWQRQVSIPVLDPNSLLAIGALCAGVALDKV